MSAPALQRVVVRMLHDPAFVAQVLAGPVPGLTEAELGWLRAVDPRRWRADPMRRYRLLQSVLAELPVAGALVVRQAGVPALDAFFSSTAFHGAIEAGQRVVVACAGWLARFGREVAALAELEGAIALARRPPPVPTDGALHRAPGVVALAPPAGTLAAWQRVAERLESHGQGRLAAVIDPKWRLPPVRLGAEPAGLIVEPGPRIGEAAEALVAFLQRLPLDMEAAVPTLAELGASEAEALELIDELQADGVIVGPGRKDAVRGAGRPA